MSGMVLLALIAVGLLTVLLAAAEVGYRLGQRAPQDDETAVSHATTWEGALLALLGLLIGFTFAMAVSRFDGRRELILEEANSIETTWLRARYLDPPVRDRVSGILVRYVDMRVRFYDAGANFSTARAFLEEARELHGTLWKEVVAVARNNPSSEMAALFVGSADELVAMEAKRRAALDNHVPLPVFFVLMGVAATAVAATGYTCGIHRRRLRLGMLLMPVLITVVIMLVFDLDYPRTGFIRAGQGAMLRLQQTMQQGFPGV